MFSDNLKKQIQRKIKNNQRDLNLYDLPDQAQKQIESMLKKKQILELAHLSMEFFKIESPSISGRLLGYFKNSKFIKVPYIYKDSYIKYKVENKEYSFNLNSIERTISALVLKHEKNRTKLKTELNKFVKSL